MLRKGRKANTLAYLAIASVARKSGLLTFAPDHLLREGQRGFRGQGQEGPEAAGVRQADQWRHLGFPFQFC